MAYGCCSNISAFLRNIMWWPVCVFTALFYGKRNKSPCQRRFLHAVFFGYRVSFQSFSLSAKHVDIAEALASATANNTHAGELIQNSSVGIDDPVKGTWGLLNRAEHSSSLALAKSLAEFEEAFEVAYEAGVIAPALKKLNEKSDFRHAALYFRRALNDFRTVWLLLGRGYTAQASTSAGSLFETSLAAICLLDSQSSKLKRS